MLCNQFIVYANALLKTDDFFIEVKRILAV
jgi:hypothetical protein